MSLPIAMVTGCEFHPPGGQQALDSPSAQLAARMKEMLCVQMLSTVDGRTSSPLGQLQWPQGKVAQPGPTSCCHSLGDSLYLLGLGIQVCAQQGGLSPRAKNTSLLDMGQMEGGMALGWCNRALSGLSTGGLTVSAVCRSLRHWPQAGPLSQWLCELQGPLP